MVREGFRFAHTQTVRFGDLDAMRHLNNVEFLRFFESARIAYLMELVPGHDPTTPESPDDFGVIFAECHIAYRAPAFFGDEIRTWLRVGEIRRSSFRIEFEMDRAADGQLLAEGWGALVGYDYVAGKAAALPDALKARLQQAVG